ncbi:MAG: FmdB family zinc ribbon protein [Syntrophobacteraceae bacterium]
MPIHEFKCKSCDNVFEYLCIRSDEKDQVLCPSCGHCETEVLLSTFCCRGSTSKSEPSAMPSSSCAPSRGFS